MGRSSGRRRKRNTGAVRDRDRAKTPSSVGELKAQCDCIVMASRRGWPAVESSALVGRAERTRNRVKKKVTARIALDRFSTGYLSV